MIILGSRYQGEPLYVQKEEDGPARQFVLRSTLPSDAATGRVHVWQDFDRIDRVAEKYLGSGDFWWMVLDRNPEVIDPQNIAAGTVLRIPDA